MAEMVEFAGIFFNYNDDDPEIRESIELLKSLEGDRALQPTRTTTHCTFAYHPSDEKVEELNGIVGDEIELEIIGYGNDGKNSGFLVRIPEEYTKYYRHMDREGNLICSHITASIDEGAAARDTKNLVFEAIKPPKKIKGRFGYWIRSKKNRKDNGHLSYDRFTKSISM